MGDMPRARNEGRRIDRRHPAVGSERARQHNEVVDAPGRDLVWRLPFPARQSSAENGAPPASARNLRAPRRITTGWAARENGVARVARRAPVSTKTRSCMHRIRRTHR